jgi:hypothetical protein
MKGGAMFYQTMMNDEERAIQQEVRKFVRDEVSHNFIRALDRDEIKYPREYVENLASHNLLGLRFAPEWGGRGLPWTAEVIAEEEIGVLGTTLGCAFVMPSIVGEALHVFGTNEIMNLLIQHEYYKEVLEDSGQKRNYELDAASHDAETEKCYTDADIWKVHEAQLIRP